jgi:hypothetical protein
MYIFLALAAALEKHVIGSVAAQSSCLRTCRRCKRLLVADAAEEESCLRERERERKKE